MYILNIARAIKKGYYSMKKELLFNEILGKKNDLLLLANKLIEKKLDPCNSKEHYHSFIRKQNTKAVKQL